MELSGQREGVINLTTPSSLICPAEVALTILNSSNHLKLRVTVVSSCHAFLLNENRDFNNADVGRATSQLLEKKRRCNSIAWWFTLKALGSLSFDSFAFYIMIQSSSD